MDYQAAVLRTPVKMPLIVVLPLRRFNSGPGREIACVPKGTKTPADPPRSQPSMPAVPRGRCHSTPYGHRPAARGSRRRHPSAAAADQASAAPPAAPSVLRAPDGQPSRQRPNRQHPPSTPRASPPLKSPAEALSAPGVKSGGPAAAERLEEPRTVPDDDDGVKTSAPMLSRRAVVLAAPSSALVIPQFSKIVVRRPRRLPPAPLTPQAGRARPGPLPLVATNGACRTEIAVSRPPRTIAIAMARVDEACRLMKLVRA